MATFKLSKVEFIQQSSGYSSSIKVQVSNIDNDECSSIPWDEFQVSEKCDVLCDYDIRNIIYIYLYTLCYIYIYYYITIMLFWNGQSGSLTVPLQ